MPPDARADSNLMEPQMNDRLTFPYVRNVLAVFLIFFRRPDAGRSGPAVLNAREAVNVLQHFRSNPSY